MPKLPEGKLKDRAESAKARSSAFGPDIDLNAFSCDAEAHKKISKLGDLPDEIKDRAASAGMNMAEVRRAGSFFQMDHSPVFSSSYQNGIEVMNITEALEKYDWLSEYWWNTLHVDADKYTSAAELRQHQGYFLRALAGVKCNVPVQACLYMSRDHLAQHVHNIIIAEPGSELNIITGCAVGRHVNNGLHIGASEFYVKKDARITFTMIHNWAEDISVRPRSTVVVEENGIFMSNYICMKPVKTIQMYPTTYCVGKNATARYYNILLAHEGSAFDIGSRVFLQAQGSRAEIITRAISEGGSIIARGHLVGEV
jgi:Fe-S cluster assembly scaffold protein SufB